MTINMIRGLFCLVLMAATPAWAQSTAYVLDKTHGKIAFSVAHFMVSSTEGQFATFDGKLSLPPGAPERGTAVIHVATASVSTGDAARDAHLRTADFFDSEHFPQMTFQSSALTLTGGSTGKLSGTLFLHGVTQPLTLDVRLQSRDRSAERLDFTASGKLKRSDFGMSSYPGVIGNEITLTIKAEFTRTP